MVNSVDGGVRVGLTLEPHPRYFVSVLAYLIFRKLLYSFLALLLAVIFMISTSWPTTKIPLPDITQVLKGMHPSPLFWTPSMPTPSPAISDNLHTGYCYGSVHGTFRVLVILVC